MASESHNWSTGTPLLEVSGLVAGYERSRVLHGIGFCLSEGEIITLLGRNGMGKTTSLKCVMGMLAPSDGSIRFAGKAIGGRPAYEIARLGIGLVPEGRMIFPTLSVEENLLATAADRHRRRERFDLARTYEFFPMLEERRQNMGNQLSGGEQQMLAIGRALMTNPRLLILDEATEGLAPLIRAHIWHVLGELRKAGMSMIIVDKNLDALLHLADRHYVITKGRVTWSGSSNALQIDTATVQQYLGV
ncbi:MAG: ABC transporter ATP-binding protein [Burkholderiaceae bacterium]|nr:ABC transporter ATP-binding protein [Burkholderiaceae bacterium]